MDNYGVPPNLAALNSLLSVFCKPKNIRKVQEIFDKMKDKFSPDSKTYSILLEGWEKSPNLPKARKILRMMADNGCNPSIVTYEIMVDVLCKAGRVDEALEVVREMDCLRCIENLIEEAVETFLEMEKNGIKDDVTTYNALIVAFCKTNKFKDVF
ncbi:hypothetical protein GIB67_001344 [Kingdonia uniflora]|uniref:Pentatricopeptide repeat-containing protein n=1 Tax=Kingdonia uniflora TaxID=39325 RepID=A0A7J7MTS6_9MAGN|nr:hypothetical protein GIB67_001344 [Kingdonia uniflora]